MITPRTNVLWTREDLLEATGGGFAQPFDANGVSIDSRTLVPDEMFVALVGENGDGHEHAAHALKVRGAAGALIHRRILVTGGRLAVDDTRAGLTRLGAFARARFAGRLVAVTGSVGKTTTKEMLRLMLSAFDTTHAAEASHNNHWGVPLTLARTPRDAKFCVVEIGMNHAGEIAPLAALARPHVAVVTAIEAAHIGNLGGMEQIADEKAAILSGLEHGGVAVLPADSPWYPRLRARADAHRVIGFGTVAAADVRLSKLDQDAEGSTFEASVGGKEIRVRLNAPGRHMVFNALAALACAVALRLDPVAAARALEAFAPVAGRGVRRAFEVPGGTALLLDESYNANGASVRAALEVLRLQPATRRIAVLGDMLELGESGPAEHAALAVDAVRAADLIFTCGPLMRHLRDAIPPSLQGGHAEDSAALAPLATAAIAPGDAILVKGSLGSRMSTIVAAFDALCAPKTNPPADATTPGAPPGTTPGATPDPSLGASSAGHPGATRPTTPPGAHGKPAR